MYPYETLAQLTYATVDFIAAEIIITATFKLDNRNNIRLRFGRFFKDTRYKSTSFFVSVSFIITIGYFYTSNHIQNTMINYITATGWKTIPSFIAVVSFFVFWTTKIILGRRWEFEVVKTSFTILIISMFILLMF